MSNIKPKIVVIGASSLFFGRQAIWACNNLSGLKGGTLALVDNNSVTLEKMAGLARLAAEASDSRTVVEAHTDYRTALPGADFVVLSFSNNNTHYRRIDCTISAKYGIRMCSGDTIGPGGVFRAMREFPLALEMTRAAEELCPGAWVINYINPSAVLGIGLMRHAKIKNFALCDTHHLPHKKLQYLQLLGLDAGESDHVNLEIAGVNHFTWMLKAQYKGENIMPKIVAALRELGRNDRDQGYSKGRFNNTITAQLSDLFGAIPTCTGHTKEYLPYYQGRAALSEPAGVLSIFDCDDRAEKKRAMMDEVDSYLNGMRSISEFLSMGRPDHATEIINTMVVEDGRTYFINRPNSDCTEGGGRAVPNLDEDAFLELECKLDRNGPRPLPVVPFPKGLRAQQNLILDIHELTIEAIVKRDRGLLLRALAMDPLVNSIATAEAVIDDLYAAQKEVLGEWVGCKSVPTSVAPISNLGETPQMY